MKISINWLADYIDVGPLKNQLKQVLHQLTMRGLEVESVVHLSQGFEKVIVAQIKTREKHPNADRLSVCQVDTGSEVLQIVCGAQNMKAGDKVALAMIGAHLPNGLKIEKGKIRSVESFGMLCSETELCLADESEGILILPKDAKVGTPLADFLERNDIVFEINVTPNRGDALSYIGVARELAAILNQKLKIPALNLKEVKQATDQCIPLKVLDPSACLQYHGRYIEGVKVGPSPQWLRKKLESIGLRSINNIVDITNFILMEWGTPLHAFDFDQIQGPSIQVRKAKKGERLPLLDQTEIELTDKDLVIADLNRPIALAGVMGGGNSEVTDKTTKIFLEAAQFCPSVVRVASKRFQKHTDSSHRFERQVDSNAIEFASSRAAQMIMEIAGGKVYQPSVFFAQNTKKPRVINVCLQSLNQFLGINLQYKNFEQSLEQIGFQVSGSESNINVHVPSYRPDIELKEDVYEEVLRVYGYDQVPAVVPQLKFIPESKSIAEVQNTILSQLKTTLVNEGFFETINFAFSSHKDVQAWGGVHSKGVVALENPLSEEFSQMKTSLLGGLFTNFIQATYHQEQNIRLFEVRPIYYSSDSIQTQISESWQVAGICSGLSYAHALASRDRLFDFYDLKGTIEKLLDSTAVKGFRLQEMKSKDHRFHPTQSVEIMLGKGVCGVMGRLHPKIEKEYKLTKPVYLFEFSLERIFELVKLDKKVSGITKFPKVLRDFSLIVPNELRSEKVVQAVQKHARPWLENISIVDVYRGEKIPSGTYSLSIAMILSDQSRTLEEKEIDDLSEKILKNLDQELKVKLRMQ